jgi:hypothetical protein
MKLIHYYSMQNNYQNNLNTALKELHSTKSISAALSVCNVLLEYMGVETKSVEDIELSKLKLPNAERYDRWFEAHPHFRGNRACFALTPKEEAILEAKFFAIKKRSKLFIAGSVNFTPNFEDRDYTRNDPNMKVGIDFFLTPEKDSVIVVLSDKGNLRLVELSGRLTNTQNEIFTLWHNIAQIKDKNALHATIWDSFKLSSLNKKFYEGIANSFTSLTQHLQKDNAEEQLANQFANRLHGRLLFLWFLRKKNIINESKEYFTIGDKNDTEYYANTLSTLFFNVLNNEDHKDLDSITPYLNGGLFDQKLDGTYWNAHSPTFPAGFFKNLYEHFDCFNFTTDESTPEYEQIAIDPEMLGRVFESFLATLTTETGAQAKKANGAFYTPREIVSYMSRESLRQYLYGALDAGVTLKSSVDDLLDLTDSEWALAGTNSKRDAVAKEDRERIMDALREIKVLDPAVGSGAFPMGILHKILSLFERLAPNFDSYETKLSILKDNIYGVDIDPAAIEISRLRAWLSIIVDAKDIKKIKPLPNLEFKFVCANSLIGLDDSEKISFKHDPNLKSTLIRIRDEYYATSSKIKKEKLQKDYVKLTHGNLFDTGETLQIKSYEPFEKGASTSFYDPELMHGVGIFDVVIGNPPYVSTKGRGETDKKILKDIYGFADDLYSHFYFKGLEITKQDTGVLSFITSKTFWTIQTKKNLRKLLQKNRIIEIFDTAAPFAAMVDTCVLMVKKEQTNEDYAVRWLDGKEDLVNPKKYQTSISLYKNAVNEVFFAPTVFNLQVYNKYNKTVSDLMQKWWSKIETSKRITQNASELENYRNLLKAGDVALLGTLTEGGQGLATGNNGKYIGVRNGTKEAGAVRDSRPKKLLEANKKIKNPVFTQNFLSGKSEMEIRELFDDLKEKHGRDVFGKGYIFRIVSEDEIADVNKMTEGEKRNGIEKSKPHFVPYDKGDKDGKRWYQLTPYSIDWNTQNVDILKRDPKARFQGDEFYFMDGISWNLTNGTRSKNDFKFKYIDPSVNDVNGMKLSSILELAQNKFLVCLGNSSLINSWSEQFINFTLAFQINDARQLPIIIPTKEQLQSFEEIFDEAFDIKKKQFSSQIEKKEAEKKLDDIQKRLDELVFNLYGIIPEEREVVLGS